MDDQTLCVFALLRDAPRLRVVWNALRQAGHPAGLSLGIAGDATGEDLDAVDWEAAFLRWSEPELHEVALIERALRGEDEQAEALLTTALRRTENTADAAGQYLVRDHLQRAQAVYTLQILPALLSDEDHPAWAALDLALRALAAFTDGLIYAAGEGYYDAEGEPLFVENSA